MHRLWCVRVIGIVVLALAPGFAKSPPALATVTSSDPIRLNGTGVPTAAVPNWPVIAGDEVATGKAPAVVSFADGTRVLLNANSRAKLQMDGKQVVVRLLDGRLAYRVVSNSPVRLAALANPVLPQSDEGQVSVDGKDALWSPRTPPAAGPNTMVFLNYRITAFDFAALDQIRKNPRPGAPPPPPPVVSPPKFPPVSIH